MKPPSGLPGGAASPLARLFLLSASPSMKLCFLCLWLCPGCPVGLRKDLGESDASWQRLLEQALMYPEGLPLLAVPIR